MQSVETHAALLTAVKTHPGVLVLFGGPTCGVCTALKPRIEALLDERFGAMTQLYVDCDAHPDLAAAEGVHTRPVARIYFDGRRHAERVRVFGLEQLAGDIERPYQLMFG